MMSAKKLFCGGLVVSQLVSFGSAGVCGAMSCRENLVYVGDNNARYGAGGCSFEQSGSGSAPQVIFVKENKKKKVKKSDNSFITPKRLLIAAGIGGAGYWGCKKWNKMTPEQQANALYWFEYAFDKFYKGAYVFGSVRGFF